MGSTLRGQALIDYLIVLSIGLVVTLIVLGLSSGLSGFGQGIQARNQLDYWRTQAQPITVPDAFYKTDNSRFYLAFEAQQDDRFNITGLFINHTQLAFYAYSPAAGDGVGALECTASSCQTSPCRCDQSLRPRYPVRIVTEPFSSGATVCGSGGQQAFLDIQLVYFRPIEPGRNLSEIGNVVLPFFCQ